MTSGGLISVFEVGSLPAKFYSIVRSTSIEPQIRKHNSQDAKIEHTFLPPPLAKMRSNAFSRVRQYSYEDIFTYNGEAGRGALRRMGAVTHKGRCERTCGLEPDDCDSMGGGELKYYNHCKVLHMF